MGGRTWLAVVVVAVGFSSQAAHAMVPLTGAFVPSDCGVPSAESSGAVAAVCVGALAGSPDGAVQRERGVQFRLSDGSSIVFRVKASSNMFIALSEGGSRSVLRLESLDGSRSATLRVTIDTEGAVVGASGLFEGAPFVVPAMERVFVIQ